MTSERQILLLTGAGSGIGMECALYLAARNYRVFGTVLNDAEGSALGAEAARRNVPVEIVRMNVTRQQDIDAGIQRVLDDAGAIDGLVQIAGVGLRGFFEDLTMEEIRQAYDVNVFGIMALTQAVLPHMRARRRGRIIITSSVAGRMGSLTISGYSSSKFAVEGFGECLSAEVRPFGIHVSLLEPGLTSTPHFTVNRNRARRATDPASPYYAWFCQHEKIVDDILARNRVTPAKVAAVVHQILSARRPRLRYMVGGNARLITSLRRYLPGEWFDRIYWPIMHRMITAPRHPATGLSGAESETAAEKTFTVSHD